MTDRAFPSACAVARKAVTVILTDATVLANAWLTVAAT